MKKWIPILLGSIGCFFILKGILKFDKNENKVVISPIRTEEVRKAIPVEQKVIANPMTNALKVAPVGPYLQSGKVNLNSKR